MKKKEENKADILHGIISGYGLDHEWAVYEEIIQICGLDFEQFIEDETLLTKELLESHYDDVLLKYPYDKENPEYFKILYPIVLGAVILKIGARLPEDLREIIVNLNLWELELKKRWRSVDDEFLNKRRKILKHLEGKIRDHTSGKSVEIDMFELQGHKFKYDWETEERIIEVCGLNFDDYRKTHSFKTLLKGTILTKRILEDNLSKILNAIEHLTTYNINNYLILAALILKTGAQISEDLRELLILKADWKEELRIKWTLADRERLNERKNILFAFQGLVQNYS